MMHGTWFRYARVIAIGSGLIATTIYLVMINVTLAHIEAVSGKVPFDMRPFGYGPDDAAALLDALGMEGRNYYLGHQIPLDTVYPALLALTLIASMSLFGRRMQDSRLVRLGIILSFGAALFDYGENLGIVAMIGTWPAPPAHLIHAASAASVAKSILTTLAVFLAFLIVLIWSRLPKADVRP